MKHLILYSVVLAIGFFSWGMSTQMLRDHNGGRPLSVVGIAYGGSLLGAFITYPDRPAVFTKSEAEIPLQKLRELAKQAKYGERVFSLTCPAPGVGGPDLTRPGTTL